MSQDDTLPALPEQDEEWRDVPNYEGLYRVSDHGRVESQERAIVYRDGRRYVVPRKILRPTIGKDGRPAVGLYLGRRQLKTFKVYRLVLTAFVGPCPDGMECRHLDGNPLNNHLSNLCWSTHAENMKDMLRHGTSTVGESNPSAKLTESEVTEIRRMYATGHFSQAYLASLFKTAESTVRRIVCLDGWKHVT